MSDVSETDAPTPKPKKPFLPPSRIALLIFVAVAAVVIVLELRAEWAFNASYEAVDRVIAEGYSTGATVYRENIGEYLSGSPTREVEGDSEIFTWNGPLRDHSMRLEYGVAGMVMKIRPQ